MIFIPRIWFSEVERIGKQKCTPVGYALQGVGDLVGFFGLLMLLGTPVYLVYRAIVGSFHWSLLWLLPLPIAVGVAGAVLVSFSWHLADRKQFQYNDERHESTWREKGEQRSFTHADWEATNRRFR